MLSASTRVKRSITRAFSPAVPKTSEELSLVEVMFFMFVVSTTSVLPSQRPRESPNH